MKNTMKAFSLILCLVMILTMFAAPVLAVNADDFTDVSENAWYYDEVNYVVENELFNGTSATTFSPADGMTRAMIVTVLYRLAGQPEVTGTNAFTDVAEDQYYADAVLWAYYAGIVTGTSKTTFSPSALVTREQIVTFLYRYYTQYKGVGAVNDKELDVFADAAEVSEFAVKAMEWAYGNEIITGKTATTIVPKGTALRCEVAALIYRFAEFMEAERKAGLRIVCMAPSMVEIVYALGFGECIVGWSAYTDYPVAATETSGYQPYQYYYNTDTADFDVEYELGLKAGEDGEYKEVATVSKFYDYNTEILEGLNANIILCEGTEQMNWVEGFREAGYTAGCWSATCLEDIWTMMIEVGEMLGAKDYAEELVAGYKARIEEIKAITKDLVQIRTYFEIAHQSDYGEWGVYGPYTEGANSPFTEMIEIAGGVNIFADGEYGYVDLYSLYGQETFAEIASRDPQVILSPYWPGAYDFEVTTLYEIMTRDHFNETEAVQTGRVYYYDSSLMKRFGPRTVTAIEKLAYLLHPYYFDNPQNSVSPWELGKIDVAENFPKPLD